MSTSRRGTLYITPFYLPFFFSFHTSTFQLLDKYPRLLPLIFIVHRVHQSHCSSIFHRVPLTHSLALSASQFVHKKILGADNLPPAPVILLLRKKKRFLIGTTSTMERYIVAEQTQQKTTGQKEGATKKKKHIRPTSISGPNTAVAMDTQSPARVPSKTVKTRSAVMVNSATSTQ